MYYISFTAYKMFEKTSKNYNSVTDVFSEVFLPGFAVNKRDSE